MLNRSLYLRMQCSPIRSVSLLQFFLFDKLRKHRLGVGNRTLPLEYVDRVQVSRTHVSSVGHGDRPADLLAGKTGLQDWPY